MSANCADVPPRPVPRATGRVTPTLPPCYSIGLTPSFEISLEYT